MLFGEVWRNLSARQKKMVCRCEVALYQWKNLRNLGAVFSTSCSLEVTVASHADDPSPCGPCQRLLDLKVFQVQLRRPMRAECNMKFVPKIWREDLGQLYLRFHGLRKLLEEVREHSASAIIIYSNLWILLGFCL